MSKPNIVVISDAGIEDIEEAKRFQRMKEDFDFFVKKSSNPFGPAGFLHQMMDLALERAYVEAYDSIGKAKDPNPYICAATHVKKCQEISKEMTDELAAAMGDMQRGDLNTDMSPALQLLKKLGISRD